MDLHEYAKTFPSQGGVQIGPWLENYAAEVPRGSAIVELGSWLGAGTAHLALGAKKSGAEIHVYDRFRCASDEEQTKAAKFGVKLEIGDDTLPLVMASLVHFGVGIHYNRQSFKPGIPVKWDDTPVGLYCDDLSKVEYLWSYAMRTFRPHFIPGKTVLVLMDFFFYEEKGPNYAAQKLYMQQHSKEFELIEERLAGTTTATFRYLGQGE